MLEVDRCTFNRAWIGLCNLETFTGSDRCPEHAGLKCRTCGEKATKECPTASSMVCGFPLCDSCRCTVCQV